MQKDKIVLGKEVTRKAVWVNILFFSLMNIVYSLMLVSSLLNWLEMSIVPSIGIHIVFYILFTSIMIPMIGATQRIEITSMTFTYYYVKGYVEQGKEVWRILRGAPEKPNIQIQLSNISYISLTYRQSTAGFAQIGYYIILNLVLEDGSTFILGLENSGAMNSDYSNVIQYLHQMGVSIVDPLHLEEALKEKEMSFTKYIEKYHKQGDIHA